MLKATEKERKEKCVFVSKACSSKGKNVRKEIILYHEIRINKLDAGFVHIRLRCLGRLLRGYDKTDFKKGIEVDHLNTRSKNVLAAEQTHKKS